MPLPWVAATHLDMRSGVLKRDHSLANTASGRKIPERLRDFRRIEDFDRSDVFDFAVTNQLQSLLYESSPFVRAGTIS